MSKDQQAKGVSNKVLITVFVIILIIINGIWYFVNQKTETKTQEKVESLEGDLVATYAKLDSISRELQTKIAQLKEMGKNVESLVAIQKQLEKEKSELRSSRNLLQTRYDDIKSKIEVYEKLLVQKDTEMGKLKEVNQALLDEVINLKNEKNEINDQNSQLRGEVTVYQEKVKAASVLKARDIRFTAVNEKGKEFPAAEFKVKQLSTLKVAFNLDENSLAEIGTKKIIMRLIDPEGSVLYNYASGTGTFVYQGNEIFFTATQEILFDNTQQLVTFSYNKGSEFKKGAYKAELYCEGAKIGEGRFSVK